MISLETSTPLRGPRLLRNLSHPNLGHPGGERGWLGSDRRLSSTMSEKASPAICPQFVAHGRGTGGR